MVSCSNGDVCGFQIESHFSWPAEVTGTGCRVGRLTDRVAALHGAMEANAVCIYSCI